MHKIPEVGGDRKKPFLPHSPPNNLGLLATQSRSTLAKGHAIAFNLGLLATLREQPWPIGHAFGKADAARTRTTSNLQPPNLGLLATLREQPPNLLTFNPDTAVPCHKFQHKWRDRLIHLQSAATGYT